MNLIRPLDEFVKESLRAKYEERQKRRKSNFRRDDRPNSKAGKKIWVSEQASNGRGNLGSAANFSITPSPSIPSPIANPGFSVSKIYRRPAGGVSKSRRFCTRKSRARNFLEHDSASILITSNSRTVTASAVSKISTVGSNARSPPHKPNSSLSVPRNYSSIEPHDCSYSPHSPREYISLPKDREVIVSVSNLHPGVTQSEVAELFETVGPLRKATLF